MSELHETHTQAMTGATIIDRLRTAGFEMVERSNDHRHVVLRRDHLEVVVPGQSRRVPEEVARMIEASLETALGKQWLTESTSRSEERIKTNEVLVLDVIVLEPSNDETWRTFLADDLTTIGYADDRNGALADLKAAAALKLGLPQDRIALMTPDVI